MKIAKGNTFKPLVEIPSIPGFSGVAVGPDLRLYRTTNGLTDARIPLTPDEPATFYLEQVHLDRYAPMGELATLFDQFLSKYEREVMFVVGEKYDKPGEFLYMVPKQVGTIGGIQWNDAEGMDWFAKQARFLGTVHIHPGDSCVPSSVDLTDWKSPINSGIHIIFARDKSYLISASVGGYCISPIAVGSLDGVKRVTADLCTAGRKLESLLLIPKPPKIVDKTKTVMGVSPMFGQTQGEVTKNLWDEKDTDYDYMDILDMVGALPVDMADNGIEPEKLYWIESDGWAWIMDIHQVRKLGHLTKFYSIPFNLSDVKPIVQKKKGNKV